VFSVYLFLRNNIVLSLDGYSMRQLLLFLHQNWWTQYICMTDPSIWSKKLIKFVAASISKCQIAIEMRIVWCKNHVILVGANVILFTYYIIIYYMLIDTHTLDVKKHLFYFQRFGLECLDTYFASKLLSKIIILYIYNQNVNISKQLAAVRIRFITDTCFQFHIKSLTFYLIIN